MLPPVVGCVVWLMHVHNSLHFKLVMCVHTTQVAFVKGGLPAWAREGCPMSDGPEDLSTVPALQAGAANDSGSNGGFKLPQFKLPQLSFGPARR